MSGDRPFIKYINWFTGFGKTYTCAYHAVDLFQHAGIIPVFIAPLQSLVSGFTSEVTKHQNARAYADEVEHGVRERGEDVPVHRLYSDEYNINDRSFFEGCLALAQWIDGSPRVCAQIEREGAGRADKTLAGRLAEMQSKARLCLNSPFLTMASGDESFEDTRDAYLKAANVAKGHATSLTGTLIRLDLNSRSRSDVADRHMAAKPVATMVRRLYPLQAFLDDPGIIVTTASKAEVAQRVYVYDEAKGRCTPRPFDNLPAFLEELNRDGSQIGRIVSRVPDSTRAVTFVDEEEDSYWFMFRGLKSVVNSEGRNDLNLVISEFFTYFDLHWPLGFEAKGKNLQLAGVVYDHLEHIAQVAPALHTAIELEKERRGAQFVPDARRLQLFREALRIKFPRTEERFQRDEDLLEVLKQLYDTNDVQSGFKRFQLKARVLQEMRGYIETIRIDGHTHYETYSRLVDMVVGKKFFTMGRSTYGEVLDQPGQTFFSDTASVMDTEFLKRVELLPDTGRQTIRLQYHPAEPGAGAYTLLSYLRLVLLIARVLAARKGDLHFDFSRQDQDTYSNLNRFRNDVRKLFKDDISSEGIDDDQADSQTLLTEEFFFNSTKSVVTLEEARKQAQEYNLPADVSLTVTITTLRATPEQNLVQSLGRSNGVYLISATGGLHSASTGAFNLRHLERELQRKNGQLFLMTEEELEATAARARLFEDNRVRSTTILDDEKPATRFGVSEGFKGLLSLFNATVPKHGEAGHLYLNRHKNHEIEGLVASLDRLLASPLRSGLVLCQTVGNIKEILKRLANQDDGWVVKTGKSGHVFTVKPQRLPSYMRMGCGTEDVVIVLYAAGPFKKRDTTKVGAVSEDDDPGQFSDELEEALNIGSKKVLLWTAYKSASRGINFITRLGRQRQDFELFCLLNDPFYTNHTRVATSGFSMEMFQSFVQVVRDEDPDWPAMTRADLLYQYARTRHARLRKEHVIDITRTVFQALGRGERRPEGEKQTQYLYVSSEAAKNVHLGLRHAAELRRRASPAQRSLLVAIDQHNIESSIYASEAERYVGAVANFKRARAFRGFTSETPKRFRNDRGAQDVWTALFQETMFTNPERYLRHLKDHGVPEAYRNGCYMTMPATAEAYTRTFDLAGMRETIITDSVDGTDGYNWTSQLAPDGLFADLSARMRALLRGWSGFVVESSSGPIKMYPQPWFVNEIMKGYVAEIEFPEFVKVAHGLSIDELLPQSDLKYLRPEDSDERNRLYQLFDFYLTVEDKLIAVDMKNWGRLTDRLQRIDLEEAAEKKHERLCELMPDRTVHSLYVNLYGAHKHTVKTPAKGTIEFLSLFVQNTEGLKTWMPNQNLATALLGQSR